MAGGQQIDSATGTIGDARTVPLRSRKTGTGAATFQLTGIASAVGQGVLRQATAVLGQAITSAQQSMSASGLWWSSTPSISIQEGSTTAVNVGSNVAGYNSFTDEFRVTPGYSLPSWLALTQGPGTGSGNLTPNGTQVDADDVAASPGLKIDVRRSGGAWVSSAAFGVTVSAPSGAWTWNDWSQFSYAYGSAQAAIENPQDYPFAFGTWPSSSVTLDTYAKWQTNIARRTDMAQAMRIITPIFGGFFEVVHDEERFVVCVVPG